LKRPLPRHVRSFLPFVPLREDTVGSVTCHRPVRYRDLPAHFSPIRGCPIMSLFLVSQALNSALSNDSWKIRQGPGKELVPPLGCDRRFTSFFPPLVGLRMGVRRSGPPSVVVDSLVIILDPFSSLNPLALSESGCTAVIAPCFFPPPPNLSYSVLSPSNQCQGAYSNFYFPPCYFPPKYICVDFFFIALALGGYILDC